MEKVFVCDLDDVVIDLSSQISKDMHDSHGILVPKEDWFYFDFRQYLPLSRKDIFNVIIEKDSLQKAKPFYDSKDFLEGFKDSHVKLFILTSRSWHNDAMKQTVRYFKNNDLHNDKIIISQAGIDKSEYLKQIAEQYEIVGFVDDNVDNIKGALGIVENIYIKNNPWNKHYNNNAAKRVFDLESVAKDLKRKKII